MKKRNIYFNHDVLPVTIYNKREDMLFRCIISYIEQVKRYHETQQFGNDTYKICISYTEEVNTFLSALYFLRCIRKPFKVCFDDIV